MNDELDIFLLDAGKSYYDVDNLMSEKMDDTWADQQELDREDGNERTREEWAKEQFDFHINSGDPSMCYDTAEKLNPDEWLIHFTDSNPYDIIKAGFRGRSVEVIGLTTHYRDGAYPGPLALAYRISDVPHSRDFGKYGKNAVIFKATEGARAYHWGDEEYQVVFTANTAHSMWPVFAESGELALYDDKGVEPILIVDRNHQGLDLLVEYINNPHAVTADTEITWEDVWDSWKKNHTGHVADDTPELKERVQKYPSYTLKDIPLNKIKYVYESPFDPSQPLNDKDDEQWAVEKYAPMKTQAPPVIAYEENGSYHLIDGRHRTRAAFLRGDKSILAFVAN